MSDLVQGEAVVLLGPNPGSLTDYSCFFSLFQIHDGRTQTVKAPSFGSPESEAKLGATTGAVTMSFLAVPHGTSGLWHELYVASKTITGELYFDYRPNTGAVSPTNPKRTGYIKVADLDMGAQAFTERRQTKTFPARAISDPITS